MLGFLKKLLGITEPDWVTLKKQNALVIDVRSPAEFKSGHVKGAVNIPLQQIGNELQKIKKQNRPVITCCRSGARSGAAAKRLKDFGIEVYNGGSWENVNRQLKADHT